MRTIPTSIDKMRRTMGHILTILDCKQTNQYTMKQLRIKNRLKKKFGNLKIKTLNYHICLLKHDLKAKSKKIRYHKNMIETKKD